MQTDITNEVKKPIRVYKRIHKKLRTLAFNNDIPLETLTCAILDYFMSDTELITKLIQKVKTK